MRRSSQAMVLAGAVALVASSPIAALAHGDEHVGDVNIVIGFGTEPAFAGVPNSVEVLLEHGGEPVVDAKGMTVDVSFGDATATYDLEPNFAVGVYGEPGDYRAWFVPSQAGPYTFHVVGEVEGQEIDVEMTSGPETFSDVEDTLDAAFPPVVAPSNEELARRLEAERTRVEAAQAAAQQAADDASTLRTLAIIALVIGAIGVIAAIAALARTRKA